MTIGITAVTGAGERFSSRQALWLGLASALFVAPAVLTHGPPWEQGALGAGAEKVVALGWALLGATVFWWGIGLWFRLRRGAGLVFWFALAAGAAAADISLRYHGTQTIAVGLVLLGLALRREGKPVEAAIVLGVAGSLHPAALFAAMAVLRPEDRRYATALALTVLPLFALSTFAAGGLDLRYAAPEWRQAALAAITLAVLAAGSAAPGGDDADGTRNGLVFAALPLLVSRPQSPDFVLMAPAYLFLAQSRHRALRAAVVVSGLLTTIVYTSIGDAVWLPYLREGLRSKTAGALLLWCVALVAAATQVEQRFGVPPRPFPRRGGAVWVFLLSGAATLVWARPLVARLTTTLPHDAGDPVLNAWILWWNSRALPLSERWWNAPIFHPGTGSLALSEHLAGLGVLTTPIIWLGGDPVLAYNAAFLLSFPLSALTAYLLCLELTGRRDAAILGGLAFAFAPYRAAQLGHIQVLSSYWMPLCLLGLHGYARSRRGAWLALFAGAWLAQGLCNGYYLFYLPVLMALWLAWFVRRRDGVLFPVLAALALAALPLVPLLGRYHAEHERLNLTRETGELWENSAHLGSWLEASPALPASPLRAPRDGSSEAWMFPGVTVVILVLVGLAIAVRARGPDPPEPADTTHAVLVAVFAAGLVVGSRAGIAGGAGLLLLPLASRRFRAAWRRRSPLGFYAWATVVLGVLCLGPVVRLPGGGEVVAGPYALLHLLPGFDALRVPARFAMVSALCLSVAAALAAARLFPTLGRFRRSVVALLATAVIAEGAIDLGAADLPARSPLLEGLDVAPRAVLELPVGDPWAEYGALYRAMYHGHPLMNGVSGHTPPHHSALRAALLEKDPEILDDLAGLGPVAVRIDLLADPSGEWTRYLMTSARARGGRLGLGERLFFLEGVRPPEAVRVGADLPIRGVSANHFPELAAGMLDGDYRTRWTSSGPQNGHEVVDVELGALADVEAAVLCLGRDRNDFPRGLTIETSEDGRSWSPAGISRGARATFRAAVEDPRRLPVRFAIPSRAARHVRLRQVGTDPTYYWSITELRIVGRRRPSPSAPGREGP